MLGHVIFGPKQARTGALTSESFCVHRVRAATIKLRKGQLLVKLGPYQIRRVTWPVSLELDRQIGRLHLAETKRLCDCRLYEATGRAVNVRLRAVTPLWPRQVLEWVVL